MISVHEAWLRWLDAAGCMPRVIRARAPGHLEEAVAIQATCPRCLGREALTVIDGDAQCARGCPQKYLAARLCDDRTEMDERCEMTSCRYHLQREKPTAAPSGSLCALARAEEGGVSWVSVGRLLVLTKQQAETAGALGLARIRDLLADLDARPKSHPRLRASMRPQPPRVLRAAPSTTPSASSTRGSKH